jgi:hypothetical protein
LNDNKEEMNARRVALIHQSFEQIAVLGDRLPKFSYAEFFRIDPSLRAIFWRLHAPATHEVHDDAGAGCAFYTNQEKLLIPSNSSRPSTLAMA